jgi:type II secretory pathway component PulF
LGALMQNGVPVLTALKITENVVQNVVLQGAIALTREGVTDGKTIAQPLARSGVFPKLMVDLVHIGEQTGDVPAALDNLAETYDNELNVSLRVVTTLIEPILIVVIALVVGFMLVGVLQAMFKITSSIGKT